MRNTAGERSMGIREKLTAISDRRIEKAAGLVLFEIMSDRNRQDLYVLDLMDKTGISSGTIYPAMMLLEYQEILVSRWESPDGEKPRRRVYSLRRNDDRSNK